MRNRSHALEFISIEHLSNVDLVLLDDLPHRQGLHSLLGAVLPLLPFLGRLEPQRGRALPRRHQSSHLRQGLRVLERLLRHGVLPLLKRLVLVLAHNA